VNNEVVTAYLIREYVKYKVKRCKDHDTLFIRFKEPERVELGELLQTKTPATLFTEEETNEITKSRQESLRF
jgi:hypothetical protein